jgi:uncharacterized protein YndB with AHSA1/START domain
MAKKSEFVYVIYIRATPKQLWDALMQPALTRIYWFGVSHDTTWKRGAPWKLKFSDGRVADAGKIIDIKKQRRIVLKWRNEFMPKMKAEGYTRCVIEMKPQGDAVKLTVAHSMNRANSKFIAAVSEGWPMILASLKSMLETGAALKILHKVSKKVK